jgi:hypothetical protein
MLLDEERAEAADHRQVGRRRTPDDGTGLRPGLRIIAHQWLRSILPRARPAGHCQVA